MVLKVLSRFKGMHLTSREISSRMIQLPEMRLMVAYVKKHNNKITDDQARKELENRYRYEVSTTLCNLQLKGCVEVDRAKSDPGYKITQQGLQQLTGCV